MYGWPAIRVFNTVMLAPACRNVESQIDSLYDEDGKEIPFIWLQYPQQVSTATTTKTLVTVAFVEPGLLDAGLFQDGARDIKHAPLAVAKPLCILLEKMEQEMSIHGISCDQKACIHIELLTDIRGIPLDSFTYSYIPSSDWPIKALIASCAWETLLAMKVVFWDFVRRCHPSGRQVHSFRRFPKGLKVTVDSDGASLQFEDFKKEVAEALEKAQEKTVQEHALFGVNTQEVITRSVKCRCADFGLHATDDWNAMRLYKIDIQQTAQKDLLQKGSQLIVQANETKFNPLRSNRPFPSLPERTLNLVKAKEPRPRITELDTILHYQSRYFPESLVFTVDKVLATRPGRWSQVFFGRITGCDKTVCLKLYDERLFPIEKNENGPVLRRHSCFLRAEDLAQREESVYHRLREFQGSLIPHCYGFHTFKKPDGYSVAGVLLEVIEGIPLANVHQKSMTLRFQEQLTTYLRHGNRVLFFGNIIQEDWNGGNIICVQDPNPPMDIHFVLIDFAFAYLLFEQEEDAYFSRSPFRISNWLQENYGVSEDVFNRCYLGEEALVFET